MYMTEVLTNDKVVIMSQYINVSNQHIVHPKPEECYMQLYLS